MESLQERIESFSKSRRVKNPSKPSASIAVKWPHPKSFKAVPDTLAEAGFYYDPSFEDRDNATCYMCGKNIGEWEADDDPFDIHWEKCGWSCGWAAVRCALREDMDRYGRFVFHEKTRAPTTKAMEKARLETFSAGDGWIHDKIKSHGANSKKMAQAGFVYTPQHSGDDLVTCLYCNVSLSGWETEDDPMEEHRKREIRTGSICPFLVFVDGRSEKPPSKQGAKLPSRTASKSKHQDLVMPTKTHDGDPDGDGASDSAASVKSGKGRKGRSTSSVRESGAKGSRLGRSASKKIDEEVEEQEVEEVSKKRGRARSKSAARSVSSKYAGEEDVDVEEETPPLTRKRAPSRARSKSVARSVPQSEDEAPAAAATHARNPSSSRAKSKALESEAEVEENLIPRKPSRSRSKILASESESEVDIVPRKSSRTTKPRPTVVVEEDEEQPQDEAPKERLTRTRSKAKIVDSEMEEEPAKPAKAKKATKSKLVSKAPSKLKVKPAPVPVAGDPQESEDPVEEDTSPPVQAKTKSPTKSPSAPPQTETDNEDMDIADVTMHDPDDIQPAPPSTPPRPTVARVSIHVVEDIPLLRDVDIVPSQPSTASQPSATASNHVAGDDHPLPSTPSRPASALTPEIAITLAPSSEDANVTRTQPSTASQPSAPVAPLDPPVIPPLSKLPFTPLNILTEAELDMTVEEWIRYQMEVEYDKFRRDGERELVKFRKKAEEVRKIIEGL